MTFLSYFKTLGFYIKRPQYYREFLRRIASMDITNPFRDKYKERHRELGRYWCQSNISEFEALCELIGLDLPLRSFRKENSEIYESAINRIQNSSIKHIQPASLDILYNLCIQMRPQIVVETGVANGWSSSAILSAMKRNKIGHLYSIDMPYPRRSNETEIGLAVPLSLRNRWTLIYHCDKEGLPIVLRKLKKIDIAHYDSDKSYRGRMFSYDLVWDKLGKNGIFISDDIGDNLAFRDFSLKINRFPWIFQRETGWNYFGILVK